MRFRYLKGILSGCFLFGSVMGGLVGLEAEAQQLTPLLHYQGRLANPGSGQPLEGIYTMTFRLYETETGGAPLWSEIKDVTASRGLISTLLGDTAALDASVFDGRALWLGVKAGADAEAIPRQRLAPVAYALHAESAAQAGNADSLEGLTAADFAPVDHGHDARYVNVEGPESISGTGLQPMLSVTQTGSGVAGRFVASKSTGLTGVTESNSMGVSGVSGTAGSSNIIVIDKQGVLGQSDSGRGVAGVSRDNAGVYGSSVNSTGVYGQSGSTTGAGVYGVNTSASGTNHGVKGENQSTDGGSGVFGSSPFVGVWGYSSGLWGVYGYSTAAGGSGVYGTAIGANSKAGYFSGNVNVTGTLSKGGGSFLIDHPLDPENKYLLHSFVESPDMMNVYNGNVVLDDSGEARVELPSWFEALNRDFRYQLTPLGAPGPNLHILREIQENAFAIAGGTPGLKVSWQVTGVRKDPYAEAHRIPVEMEKPPEEKGTYLHPAEYGADVRKGLNYRHEAKLGKAERAN